MRFRGLSALACAVVAALGLTLGEGGAASAGTLPAVPGSALVLYAAAGTDTLYVISPGGQQDPVARIADSEAGAQLIAWSADGERALVLLRSGAVEQVVLATGQVSRITVAAGVTVVGYAGSDGLSILGERTSGGRTTLARYTLGGALCQVLASWPSSSGPDASPFFGTAALPSPSGDFVVLPGTGALSLVSSWGGSKSLTLPVSHGADCAPVRWWQPGVVLAECSGPGIAGPRLWLVPTSGARPAALTPERGENGPDYGDINGWRLDGGLYVQALASCGPPFIAAAHPNGTVTPLLIPGVAVAQAGQWLLTEQAGGCEGSTSLLWYDPVTGAKCYVFHTPAADAGVISAVAFDG